MRTTGFVIDDPVDLGDERLKAIFRMKFPDMGATVCRQEGRVMRKTEIDQALAGPLSLGHVGHHKRQVIIDRINLPNNIVPGHDAPEVDGQVWIKSKSKVAGKFIKVKITDTLEYDLVGEEA